MISLVSMFDELEKIAIGQAGADTFRRMVESARKEKRMKEVPFMEGLKRNVVATGRRLGKPERLLSRAKWSVTNPVLPKWMRAVSGAGLALSAASALPKQDPSGGGKSRLRRALSAGGGLVGGSAGRGISGGLIGGAVGSTVGDVAGKAADKLRGYKPKKVTE